MMVGLVGGNRFVQGNISCDGVGFELSERVHLKPNDSVAIVFVVPDSNESLVLNATVTRVERAQPMSIGKTFIGARFNAVDVLVENPLYRFVEEAALLAKAPITGSTRIFA